MYPKCLCFCLFVFQHKNTYAKFTQIYLFCDPWLQISHTKRGKILFNHNLCCPLLCGTQVYPPWMKVLHHVKCLVSTAFMPLDYFKIMMLFTWMTSITMFELAFWHICALSKKPNVQWVQRPKQQRSGLSDSLNSEASIWMTALNPTHLINKSVMAALIFLLLQLLFKSVC